MLAFPVVVKCFLCTRLFQSVCFEMAFFISREIIALFYHHGYNVLVRGRDVVCDFVYSDGYIRCL